MRPCWQKVIAPPVPIPTVFILRLAKVYEFFTFFLILILMPFPHSKNYQIRYARQNLPQIWVRTKKFSRFSIAPPRAIEAHLPHFDPFKILWFQQNFCHTSRPIKSFFDEKHKSVASLERHLQVEMWKKTPQNTSKNITLPRNVVATRDQNPRVPIVKANISYALTNNKFQTGSEIFPFVCTSSKWDPPFIHRSRLHRYSERVKLDTVRFLESLAKQWYQYLSCRYRNDIGGSICLPHFKYLDLRKTT